MPKKLEFTEGQTFGKWYILGAIKHIGTQRMIKCRCECGTEKFVNVSSLSKGKSKSCGCGIYTHGMTGTRIYTIYDHIKQRCTNPKNPNRPLYGGKGVKNLWNSFEDFYRDMGESYENHVRRYGEKNTTIDRLDSGGNYCKENCRWATRLEQSNNLTSNRKITYKGKEYATISSLCREFGIGVTTMNQRINKYGWSIERAVETPIQIHKKH